MVGRVRWSVSSAHLTGEQYEVGTLLAFLLARGSSVVCYKNCGDFSDADALR